MPKNIQIDVSDPQWKWDQLYSMIIREELKINPEPKKPLPSPYEHMINFFPGGND